MVTSSAPPTRIIKRQLNSTRATGASVFFLLLFWLFIRDLVRPEKTPLNEDYDEWGVARKFCTCPPGSSDPVNYPEVFGESLNTAKTGCKSSKKVDNDDPILPDGHCKPELKADLDVGVYDQYYGAQDGCKSLIPGFLPNDTFLITCDAAMPWVNGHHKDEIVEDRDMAKYPIRWWIMGKSLSK